MNIIILFSIVYSNSPTFFPPDICISDPRTVLSESTTGRTSISVLIPSFVGLTSTYMDSPGNGERLLHGCIIVGTGRGRQCGSHAVLYCDLSRNVHPIPGRRCSTDQSEPYIPTLSPLISITCESVYRNLEPLRIFASVKPPVLLDPRPKWKHPSGAIPATK